MPPQPDSETPSRRAAPLPKPSLAEVFEEEEPKLVRYAFSLLGRREVAEEVVQDVFIQLHKHWDEVEHPRAWLFRSVRNRSYNQHRDTRREVLSDDGETGHEQDESAEAPDEVLRKLEANGFLRLMIEELPERDREVVHLKYFENLKYAEIAEQTGMTIGNVGYRLHHTLNTLADKLRGLGIEGSQA